MYNTTNPTLCRSGNRLHLELLTFGFAGVDPGWSGNVVLPVYSRLYYITAGAFTIQTADGEVIKLQKGNWYLIPSGCSFTYHCNKIMEHFYFHIKLRDFDGTDLLRSCQNPLCLTPEAQPDTAFLTHCLTSSAIPDGLRLRQTVLDVLTVFLETHNIAIRTEDYSPCIYKALVYIKQNLSMRLTLSQIAENIYISKSTLTKHFQKELGMSVGEYICSSIMAEAERLLMTSNISIHDLSQKFGFSYQLYFSRRFKEKFGTSPRNYRKIKGL